MPPRLLLKHPCLTCLQRFVAVLLLLCSGCQTSPEPPLPNSAWGIIVPIVQVEQIGTPALWADPTRVIAAWIGADAGGIHHDARGWVDGKLSPVVVLPLPPVHPYTQSWVMASGGNLHLLWLDATSNGQTRLYSALLDPQLNVVRGPTAVSDVLALRYAAVPGSQGEAWVVWSGNVLAEPALNLQAVDEGGRPQLPQRVATNADYPAMARANDGTMLLFWLEGGQLMRAVVSNGAVLERSSLMNSVFLGVGDRLHSLRVGLDQTHAIVFWNITRMNGENEIWFVSTTIGATSTDQPTLLTMDTLPGTVFETGFNTGSATGARTGEIPLSWASPLPGQYETLPVTVQSPTGLGMVYFRDGVVAGYQEIVEGTQLIDEPTLIADRNRDLYLAWFEPSVDGAATFLLTTTKR